MAVLLVKHKSTGWGAGWGPFNTHAHVSVASIRTSREEPKLSFPCARAANTHTHVYRHVHTHDTRTSLTSLLGTHDGLVLWVLSYVSMCAEGRPLGMKVGCSKNTSRHTHEDTWQADT